MSTPSNTHDPKRKRGVEPRPDPRVSTVPLPTEDGGEVVIQQQNVGPDNQVGAGEFKQSDETALHRDPAQAAEEQERLEARAPTEDGQPET
jgi:uncharacterized sporulation protein YeaH/YhbH (DUF444 family)